MYAKKTLSVRSNYSNALRDPDRIIEKAKEDLTDVNFDTIVGTGTSGLLILPQLAKAFSVNYLAIRKPNDRSHSAFIAEGELGSQWLMVDDFVATGRTLARCYFVVKELAKSFNHRTECVGIYQYEVLYRYLPATWVDECVTSWVFNEYTNDVDRIRSEW